MLPDFGESRTAKLDCIKCDSLFFDTVLCPVGTCVVRLHPLAKKATFLRQAPQNVEILNKLFH